MQFADRSAEILEHRRIPAFVVVLGASVDPSREGPDVLALLLHEAAVDRRPERRDDAAAGLDQARLVAGASGDAVSVGDGRAGQAPGALRCVAANEHLAGEPPRVDRMHGARLHTPSGSQD